MLLFAVGVSGLNVHAAESDDRRINNILIAERQVSAKNQVAQPWKQVTEA